MRKKMSSDTKHTHVFADLCTCTSNQEYSFIFLRHQIRGICEGRFCQGLAARIFAGSKVAHRIEKMLDSRATKEPQQNAKYDEGGHYVGELISVVGEV
jgi:hypothetical protein